MVSDPIVVAGLVRVIAHAVAVFGDEERAAHWLSAPLAALDDRAPAEHLATREGVDRVERLLIRIELNIPV